MAAVWGLPIDFKVQKRFCNVIQSAYVSYNKFIKVCVDLVALGYKSNIFRTWNLFVQFIILIDSILMVN